METKSPFSISENDVRTLEQNDGFRVVRAYLSAEGINAFCTSHSSLCQSGQQTFMLHRDILHALLLPLLQIRSQAALFAAQTLSRHSRTRSPVPLRSVVDLELAFRGAARGAFSWLQCFVTEERDWCSTKGCPACVVLRILHSEPFIRVVVAACRLSAHLRDILPVGGQGDGLRTTITSLALLDFGFWLSAVHQAVSEDEFWGLRFWDEIEARAEDLELGVKDLIRQCCATYSPSPTAPSHQRRTVTFGNMPCAKQSQPVKNGSLVKRQLRLQEEEQEWLRKIIEACWLALMKEAAYKRRKVSASMRVRPAALRIRSLTT